VTDSECARWSGHVVVCGLEDVGLRTVEQLTQAGVRVVVVDDSADRRRQRTVDGWQVPRPARSRHSMM